MEVKEIWLDIKNWEGMYQVSNLGRVRSLDRKVGHARQPNRIYKGKILKNVLNSHYLNVSLSRNCEWGPYNIHRLVAETFIPNPHNKPQVNHKDGNKLNNYVSNLEWVTRSENSQHAVRTGLLLPTSGEKHGRSKLTEKQVLEIRKVEPSYSNSKPLAKKFKVSEATIYDIWTYRSWYHIMILLLCLSNSPCIAQFVIPNWLADSASFEIRKGRQCGIALEASQAENKALGEELLHTGTALELSQRSNETLSSLLRNSRDAQEIQGLQFQKDLNSERRKTKRWRKVGIIEGVGLIGLLILIL